MKIAIMQPYFFPYIGYFQAIHAVDKYLLYDNLNFIKKAWMNRNRFLVINGKPTYFYAELKFKSSFKKIYEIELVNNNSWRGKVLKNIYFNYKNAMYFEEVYPIVESIVNYPTNKLTELNYQSIIQVCNYLQITTIIDSCSERYMELETQLGKDVIDKNDFPELSITNLHRKTIRVLSICKKENANCYINAIGGKTLYNKDEFEKNGVSLFFIKPNSDLNYKQLSDPFMEGLSIIDTIMNCGKEGTKNLINKYSLI